MPSVFDSLPYTPDAPASQQQAPAQYPSIFHAMDAHEAQQQAGQKAMQAAAPSSGIGNAFNSAISAIAEPGADFLLRGVHAAGLTSDEEFKQQQATHPLPSDPSRVSGMIGRGLGGAAQFTNPVGIAVGAAGAGEEAYQQVEGQRQQFQATQGMYGANPSTAQAATDVLGQAGLNLALAKLAPGGRLGQAVLSPGVAPAVLGAAGRVLGGAAIGSGEMFGVNAASNALTQQTGVNPNQSILEGSLPAIATGAIFGGAGQAGHEVGARLNPLQAAREANARRTAPYDWQADRPPQQAPQDHPQGEDAGYAGRLAEGQNALADARRQHAEAVAERTKGPAVGPLDTTEATFQPATEAEPETLKRMGERRITTTPVDEVAERRKADTERRFEEISKTAEFPLAEEANSKITPQTPEAEKLDQASREAYKNPEAENYKEQLADIASQRNDFFQKKSGEHAATEEYGKPAETQTPKGPTPSEDIRDLASTYHETAGIPEAADRSYAKVDPDRAKQIASDYDAMKHDPSDPKVKASYDAMKAETLAQYQHLKDAGYSFSADPTGKKGYESSQAMRADVNHKHLNVFTGNGPAQADHPLAEAAPANAQADGLMSYNDVFRAVHDVFGHAKEGVGFGPRGEENAWRQHVQMYSPEARGAMTAETRGQNSWVNFGPKGEANQANPKATTYAEQKAGLLPEEHTQVEAPNLLQRLAKEESGGVPIEPFMRRDVVPAAAKIVEGAKALAKSLDRHLDLGFSKTAEGKKTGLSLGKTLGDAIQAGHAFEDALVKTGARDAAPKFSVDEQSALAHWDYLDGGGQATNPKEQAALDLIQSKRQENAVRAKKIGVPLADVEGEGLSRVFTFPEGKAGSRSLAGAESFRKSQTYDKPSDAFKAAKAAGGKPAYDNIYDMQLARQYEIERSLSARENLRAADIGGTIRWFPEGSRADEGFPTTLEDRAATEVRKMALPSWQVGRLAKMEHFGAQSYLKENADKLVDVRPGEQPPQGYSFTGKEVRGTYHAPEDTARTFNDMLGKGRGDPIESLPGTVARATIMQRYGLSVVHAFNGLKAYLNQQTGTALSAMTGKGNADAQQGVQSVTNATVYGGWKRGLELQREIEKPGTYPGLAEVAKRVVQSNPETKFKSVLDRPKLADAVDEFKAGNWQGGIVRVLKTAIDSVPDFIYHGVLDKLDLSVRRDLAERQIRQGTTAEAGATDLSQAGDTISRALGRHANSPAFKNSMVTTVGKILAPAFQYKAGLLRNALIEPLRGNPHAQAQLVGAIVNTALMGAATTAALTYANTGKVSLPQDSRDYWNPRTGNQDANGHDERISMPGYEAFLMRSVGGAGTKGMKDELVGSLNPALVGTKETIENRDFYGNQVRPDEGSTLGNAARATGHILKGAAPISVMGGLGNNPEGDDRSWGMKLYQGIVGGTVSRPVTSDAEQTAYDILNKNQQGGRNLAEQEIHDNSKKWVKMIKGGQEDQATEEMGKNPAMSESRMQSVFRRAAGEQGLAGLVADTQFKPIDLLNIWNKATPGEQAKMREPLLSRLSRANPTSEAEGQEWQKLQEAVE